jgi:ribose transport system permease protein
MKKIRWQPIFFRNPYLLTLVLLFIAILVNTYCQPDVFGRTTLNNNMRVLLPLVCLAAGQAVVVLGGGIDISVGAIVRR